MSARVLLVEDNLPCAEAIVTAVPEVQWVYAGNGIDALAAWMSAGPFDAVLLDMNLPGFLEHPWLEPLRWLPRTYRVEGEFVLRVIRRTCGGELDTFPVIAISGVPANNEALMQLGATHRADGKDPVVIRAILVEAGVL